MQSAVAAPRAYRTALDRLTTAGVPFCVGGAYAVAVYTGLNRTTRDLDLFLRPTDVERALTVLDQAGFRVALVAEHWLGKARHGPSLIDLVFSQGNGLQPVDDRWLARARPAVLWGRRVRVLAPEDLIWSKAYLASHDRFDGADIVHLIRATAGQLDWPYLLARFGEHRLLLLAHLTLVRFVYPSLDLVPPAVITDLVQRCQAELSGPGPADRLCRGTLLDAASFWPDVTRWGYRDARSQPPSR